MVAEVCLCGHVLAEHVGTARICGRYHGDRLPRCWGWFPQGGKAIEVDEHGEEVTDEANPRDQVGVDPTAPAAAAGPAAGPPDLDHTIRTLRHLLAIAETEALSGYPLENDPVNTAVSTAIEGLEELQRLRQAAAAGPPDLQHAIQAATDAFDRELRERSLDAPDIIRIAVEAAAPVLLQAMQQRHNDLAAMIQEWHQECIRLERELQATRDRLHILEVEVRDLTHRLAAAGDGPAAQEEGG